MAYEAGYIKVVNGSDQVEGLGTSWLDYAKTGDTIFIGDLPYKIIAIDDNHLLTLYEAYTGESTDQATYSIENVEKPGKYYRFNTATLEWEASAPTPIIQELVITIGFKKLSFTWSVLDSVYGDIGYETEIWSSLTNDFATATLHSTTADKFYEAVGLMPVPNFYWFRAVYEPDATVGVKLASGSQTPIAVQTKDIEPNATSISEFGSYSNTFTGVNMTTGIPVLAGTVTNPTSEPLIFSLEHICKQSYSSGAKATHWIFAESDGVDYTAVCDFGVFSSINELPVLKFAYAVPANSAKNIALFWFAADNTVTISKHFFSFFGLLR